MRYSRRNETRASTSAVSWYVMCTLPCDSWNTSGETNEAIGLATNRRTGTPLQVIGALGVVVAYFVRNLVAGDGFVPTNDLVGLIVLLAGIVMVINRLRG